MAKNLKPAARPGGTERRAEAAPSMNQIIITEYRDLAQSGNFWAMVLVPFGTA
jgi:hypothetical protein